MVICQQVNQQNIFTMYFNLYENFLKSKIFGLLKSISHPSKVFGRKKLLFQFGSRTSFSNAEKMQNQISFKVEKSHINRSGWNTDFVGKRKKVVKQAVTSKSYVCFLFACAKKKSWVSDRRDANLFKEGNALAR